MNESGQQAAGEEEEYLSQEKRLIKEEELQDSLGAPSCVVGLATSAGCPRSPTARLVGSVESAGGVLSLDYIIEADRLELRSGSSESYIAPVQIEVPIKAHKSASICSQSSGSFYSALIAAASSSSSSSSSSTSSSSSSAAATTAPSEATALQPPPPITSHNDNHRQLALDQSPRSSLTSIPAAAMAAALNSQGAAATELAASCTESNDTAASGGPGTMLWALKSRSLGTTAATMEEISLSDERQLLAEALGDAPGASGASHEVASCRGASSMEEPLLLLQQDGHNDDANREHGAPATRLERSNSCSQAAAECTSLRAADDAQAALQPSSKLSATSSCISIIGASERGQSGAGHDFQPEQELKPGSYTGDTKSRSLLEAPFKEAQVAQELHAKQIAPSAFGTSRFFSSKLNTGSLWSLLSAGGANSSSLSTSSETSEQTQIAKVESNSVGQQKVDQDNSRQPLESSRSTSSFFTRQFQFQNFKRTSTSGATSVASQVGPAIAAALITSCTDQNQGATKMKLNEMSSELHQLQQNQAKKRHRFNIKYIGNTLLHKNFTLSMLEWIVRDVKRQTLRGAQGINQRQFSIPARDIVFEIQSNQLTAISCKDGHCIFVHPMHCVSKYAQIQHDPTCFAYIIRDSKEAPSFCHVFQAKSTTKVHELFSAIREATTTRANATAGLHDQQQLQQLLASNQSSTGATVGISSAARGLQKSASTEGHWRSLIGSNAPESSLTSSSSSYITGRLAAEQLAQQAQEGHRLDHVATRAEQAAASLQFENSYQFEVMFVKRVKLQCRRVPASFVDDALETLKSFEGPKAQMIKSVVSKRIINASVDERQEYDEQQQQQQQQSEPAKSSVMASQANVPDEEHRRGSSVSLTPAANAGASLDSRESKSCHQSPAKSGARHLEEDAADGETRLSGGAGGCGLQQAREQQTDIKKHQSVDCLKSIADYSLLQTSSQPPAYANDFSPYNTITSSDLNERIAAIPVVSGSSVSLDHEMRQKLARQVRETIMATAANIKKGVYASGDKLDSSSSCKALDSLSCNVVAAAATTIEPLAGQEEQEAPSGADLAAAAAAPPQQPTGNKSASNNFDLFRRASARQVVKNRTMLLLIGKDELCAISIDKHQLLFSKSFSSIVHCLQGMSNRDHFGLICRDSGKINPQAESYAGFVFKCQSEKVVREIMGALRQVIYNSQHNYHAQDSPYNPLNAASVVAAKPPQQQQLQQSPKFERAARPQTRGMSLDSSGHAASKQEQPTGLAAPLGPPAGGVISLAAKRGFTAGQIGPLDEAVGQFKGASGAGAPPPSAPVNLQQHTFSAPKNPIKSMFCDNCPLYWYHRLCCDIESLPSEASKTIILRRIDSSLSEKEQDEVYSKFSEFKIDSIEQHNEIFMSILRNQCERKQNRHSQSQAHQTALAQQQQLQRRSISMQRDTSASAARTGLESSVSSANPMQQRLQQQSGHSSAAQEHLASSVTAARCHQRSGSSSGSLAQFLPQQQQQHGHAHQAQNGSFADASSSAIDNLKRAKNSISVSIENMLKRRSSAKDETTSEESSGLALRAPLSRAGSFKGCPSSRGTTGGSGSVSDTSNEVVADEDLPTLGLKRSQSSTDSAQQQQQQQQSGVARAAQGGQMFQWRDSILSRTFNAADVDLAAPLVGFFRRRGSFAANIAEHHEGGGEHLNGRQADSKRTSTESLPAASAHYSSAAAVVGRLSPPMQPTVVSHSSPSHLLSGSFWKKNIFDKVHQPSVFASKEKEAAAVVVENHTVSSTSAPKKRTRAEIRLLWQKAIREQVTLLKMDKQNQELQKRRVEPKVSSNKSSTCCSCDEDSAESSQTNKIKLNYRDVLHGRDAVQQWERLLKQDPTNKVEFAQVAHMVRLGVPKKLRGEIWMFLMNQYQLRHGTSFQLADSEYKGDANQTYRSLLSKLSTQQHEIFVDIGRTFPTHPYYSQYLSIGQLSLFNLLKAYSLLDQEVGYCQGLSFVAGILLLHVDSEDEAFELMRHLLFNFGLRKQYLPSMNALHLQLYQITRLLRDHEYDIFNHFDRMDISPSLYAAPWFLTLFASQFPLGFVSRLLDLIFLIGIEAIFRISLTLLAYHKTALLRCSTLELTMEFMRNDLVKVEDKNLAKIFGESMLLDLRNKLIEYEIEYSFYCAEDKARAASSNGRSRFAPDYRVRQTDQTSLSDAKVEKRTLNEDEGQDNKKQEEQVQQKKSYELISSEVADATATVIIQHLLANNHLKSLRSNYSY